MQDRDYRLVVIALQNLLDLYDVLGVPEGTEVAVEELKALKLKVGKLLG